jgi:NADPH2:quinone reductase
MTFNLAIKARALRIWQRQVERSAGMRAFRGNALGDIDSFAIEDVVPEEPALGEIRVNVEATALGFVDQLVMRGQYQVKPDLPFIPGGEIVGTVDKVGEGVRGFTAGQRVATWQFGGGLADQAIIKASRTVPIPDEVEFGDAAAILLDYLTAYYALFDIGRLKPGQSLLVTGASGGVGSAAIQLAKAGSSFAVGLASGVTKRGHVKAIGASSVLDYRDEDWRSQLKIQYPNGIDMVFDPVGGALFELCFRSLAKRGRHLIIGFASGDGIPCLPANLPLLKSGELIGVDARYLSDTDPGRVREILTTLLGMAARRIITPVIASEFGLEDAANAFRALSGSERIGKVIVQP